MSISPDELTQSTACGSPTGRRLLALWEGGFHEFALPEQGSLDIGRSQACKLRVDHASVSRRHLLWHATTDSIEDCGSSNGTRLNGERIPKGAIVPIRPGDTVEIGRVLLVFQVAMGPQAAPNPSRLCRLQGGKRPPANPSSEGEMAQVRRLVELAAPTNMTVLLLGETGVGKDVLAETIHRLSARAKGPFVRINCVALSEALLESELFGHEKGSFTGAVQSKPGLLEAAHGGTLLLDEVGEIPLALQAKLLVALERREVLRVGSTRPKSVDVRFVAATNKDLDELAPRGEFRADLLHRLNGVTIRIAPLRARTGEIEALAHEFASRACQSLGRPEMAITPEAGRLLREQPYPGNIRELKNLVERAVAFAPSGVLDASTIELALAASASVRRPPGATRAPAPDSLRSELETLERARILGALEECSGNQTKAALLLGLPRRTLVTRLSSYGVSQPRTRKP